MIDAVKQALENVHTALNDNNNGLDIAIVHLKKAIAHAGAKTVLMEKTRLPQNNRQGRKMLQTYFKKRGVIVEFEQVSETTQA